MSGEILKDVKIACKKQGYSDCIKEITEFIKEKGEEVGINDILFKLVCMKAEGGSYE